ncbi:MAG: hypothetical protein D6820_04245, partial [Lentisphaerae bacterium]
NEFDIALKSYRQALACLDVAEKKLKELMADEAARKQALTQRYKQRVDQLRKEFDTIRKQLVADKCTPEILAPADKAAKQAEIVCAAGNLADGFKRWQEALIELKNSQAEWQAHKETSKMEDKLIRQRMAQQCVDLQEKYQKLRKPLAQDPLTQKKLDQADALTRKAIQAQKSNNVKQAINLWQAAINELQRIETARQFDISRQARKMRSEVNELREELKKWEGWDPTIAEQLVQYDVVAAMARDEMKRLDFRKACLRFAEAKKILLDIRKTIEEKIKPTPGKDFTVGKTGIEMVWIPALKMWVGRYEIRNREYRLYQSNHSSQAMEGLSLDKDEQPVCYVSYYDAVAYCAWLNKICEEVGVLPKNYRFRLPTKDEWIFFATCGHPQRKFPWGDEWPPKEQVWNFANQEIFPRDWRLHGYRDPYPVTCDVRKSGKNEWGLYGISGNVWEWTSDTFNGKRAVYGGSWASTVPDLMKIDLKGKNYTDPQRGYDNVGFRIVLAPKNTR